MQYIAFHITFAVNTTRRWEMTGAARTEHVWKCQKQSVCLLQPTKEFRVNVGGYQGFCPSPLLTISLLETPSQGFRTRCPWENLCEDYLVIIAESLEELL